jgi:DNA-binding transcriptional LysR family regulator
VTSPAFVANPDQMSTAVIAAPVACTGLAVISNGKLNLPPTVAPADLLGQRVLVNPAPSPIHTETVRWFRGAGAPVHHLSTCNSLPITIELVRAGGGTGVVPVHLVRELVRQGSVNLHKTRPRMRALRQCLIHAPTAPAQVVTFLLRVAKDAAKASGFSRTDNV